MDLSVGVGPAVVHRKVAVVAMGGNRVIRLQLDRRGVFRSIVRGQPLDLDCRHANLARHIQTRHCCAYHGGEEHHQQRAVRTLKECFHTLVTNDISVLMSLASITPSLSPFSD